MLHLALMGLLGVGLLILAIKNRVWELSVTVEMPAREKGKDAEAPKEAPREMTKPE